MRHRRGFTLIELLVVIAIIALLVSILMPSLQKAKELAKDVVCKSNGKNMSYGIILYAQEYDDQIPYQTGGPPGVSAPPQDPLSWAVRIGKIPEDQIPDVYTGAFGGGFNEDSIEYKICEEGYLDFNYYNRTEGAFKCLSAFDQIQNKSPLVYSDGDKGAGWGSVFSINEGLSDTFLYVAPDEQNNHKSVMTTDVRGGVVMIGDGHLRQGGGTVFFSPRFRVDNYGDLATSVIDGDLPSRYGPWPHQPYLGATANTPLDYYGHPGESCNLAFLDGHVASQKEIDPADWNIE